MVQIKTYEPIENKKVFTGYLKIILMAVIIIEDGKDYTIPRLKISSARLKFNWNGV